MRRIETIVGDLAVYELGAAGPPTLLWPSLYVDHASLLPVATELARTRRCILLDGPGHGASTVTAGPFTLPDCATAAMHVLDRLGIDAVDWIGNAWGGHVGVCAAVATPARVRTLSVIGAPMTALSPAMRRKSRAGLALMALGLRGFVGKLIAKTMLSPTTFADHVAYVQAQLRGGRGIPHVVRAISLGRPDLTPELARVAAPTLFVAGGDDPMWSPDDARRDAASLRDGRVVVVPGAAHLAPLERPRETLAAVASFLAEPRPSAAAPLA